MLDEPLVLTSPVEMRASSPRPRLGYFFFTAIISCVALVGMERCGAILCEDALRGFALSGFVLDGRLHREGEDAP